MRHGKRLVVHRVGQQRIRVDGLVDRKATDEVRRASDTKVSTVQPYIARRRCDTSHAQQFCHPHAGPPRRTHCTLFPLHTRDRWIKEGAAVAGALQRDDHRPGRRRFQVGERQFERPRHVAIDAQSPGVRVDGWRVEVRADVKEVVRGNPRRQQMRRRLEVLRARRPYDESILGQHLLRRHAAGRQEPRDDKASATTADRVQKGTPCN